MGHRGVHVTFHRIASIFFVQSLHKAVADYIKTCKRCIEWKRGFHPSIPRRLAPQSRGPMDIIAIDWIHNLPRSYQYNVALVVIDLFTRYLWIIPTNDQSGGHVCRILANIFNQFGWPTRILSDRAPEFIQGELKELEQRFKIKPLRTSGYHPQTNGNVERVIGSISDLLRVASQYSPSHWSHMASAIMYAYNTSFHQSIRTTPFFLMFGRLQHPLPDEYHLFNFEIDMQDAQPVANSDEQRRIRWAQVAAQHTVYLAQQYLKAARDQILADSPYRRYHIGDWVYIHLRPRVRLDRTHPRRIGPYEIEAMVGDVTYRVKFIEGVSPQPLPGKSPYYHASLLTPYLQRAENPQQIEAPFSANHLDNKYDNESKTDAERKSPNHNNNDNDVMIIEPPEENNRSIDAPRYSHRIRYLAGNPNEPLPASVASYRPPTQSSSLDNNSDDMNIDPAIGLSSENDFQEFTSSFLGISSVTTAQPYFSEEFSDTSASSDQSARITKVLHFMELLHAEYVIDNPHYYLLPRPIQLMVVSAINNPHARYEFLLEKVCDCYNVVIKSSPIHGQGLFTTRPISNHESICSVFGTYFRHSTITHPDHPLFHDDNLMPVPPHYTFQGEQLSIFLHYLCLARFINHQPFSKANAALVENPAYRSPSSLQSFRAHHGSMFPAEPFLLLALRDIQVDEEITISYDTSDDPYELMMQRDQKELTKHIQQFKPALSNFNDSNNNIYNNNDINTSNINNNN